MSAKVAVEVVFATPESQALVELQFEYGATIADAIAKSGLVEAYPQYSLHELPVGIWGRVSETGQVLRDGDRVEIYRQLRVDPMESRRLKAQAPSPVPRESH
ncbi:MAG: RnfH family protein [Gammaproteobacteria bacterium]